MFLIEARSRRHRWCSRSARSRKLFHMTGHSVSSLINVTCKARLWHKLRLHIHYQSCSRSIPIREGLSLSKLRVDTLRASSRCNTRDMADNEDIKERMRQALDAKNQKSAKNTPHGTAPTESNAQEHADREGGKREFRRKSGSS